MKIASRLIILSSTMILACKPTKNADGELEGTRQVKNTLPKIHVCDVTLPRGDYKVTYQIKFVTRHKLSEKLLWVDKVKVQATGRHKDGDWQPKTGKPVAGCSKEKCKMWESKIDLVKQRISDSKGESKLWVGFREDWTPVFRVSFENFVPEYKMLSNSYKYEGVLKIRHFNQKNEKVDDAVASEDMLDISASSCRSNQASQVW